MAFRNGFIFTINKPFSNKICHDTVSPYFPYKSSDPATFRQQLKVDAVHKFRKKEDLIQAYSTYCKEYLPWYKKWILETYSDLKCHFPDVDFAIKSRIKSQDSYEKKVIRKLSEGHVGNIYDIFASKIIIYGILDKENNKMNRDENDLIRKCYEFPKYFYDKKDCNIDDIHDFIKNQKESGYRSIHLLQRIEKDPFSYLSELQIKTFRMHENEDVWHRIYKDRNQLLKQNSHCIEKCVPHYMEIYENRSKGKLSIFEKPFDSCFEEFFNISYKEYTNSNFKQSEGR